MVSSLARAGVEYDVTVEPAPSPRRSRQSISACCDTNRYHVASKPTWAPWQNKVPEVLTPA